MLCVCMRVVNSIIMSFVFTYRLELEISRGAMVKWQSSAYDAEGPGSSPVPNIFPYFYQSTLIEMDLV